MSARFPNNVFDALQTGNPVLAEQLCRKRLGILPRDAAARSLLPIALIHQSRHAEAIPLLEVLAASEPDERAHAVNLGLALLAVGRADDAVVPLERAARRWPDDPALRSGLGQALLQRGLIFAALTHLQTAVELDPGDTHATALLVRALVEAGEQQEAAGRLADSLLVRDPPDAASLTELALALIGLQRDPEAETCFARAIQLDPAFDAPRIHLALLQERQNRLEAAGATLHEVNATAQADPLWQLAHGRLLRRARRYEEAATVLQALVDKTAWGPIVAEAATELGRVLHELQRPDDAFEMFSRANQWTFEQERRGIAAPAEPDSAAWLLRTYTATEVAGWSPAVRPAARTPVFVVGFPRSGTTLLENMLDAHPSLQALEERPAVDAMLAAIAQEGDIDSQLAQLTEAGAEAARKAYWTAVSRYVDLRPGTTLIDRYPLNMARLAVLYRVFPGAPIVLAVRHPCDVVLSCMMQNFRIRDGSAGFHTLLSGARIYDRLMRKWLAEVAAFQPVLHVIRYEDLVADVATHARRLVDFIGVPWDESILDHAGHALRRGRIHTPSYSQVVQPIYRSAVERWRAYARYFGQAGEVLAPWVRHWGYEELQP